MKRRTLLKSLALGAATPWLAPLISRVHAETNGGPKPMRFVFVIIDNGLWPDHVMPAGFKRQEMKNPLHGLNGGGRNPINGADELIDLPLGGPDLPLFEGLAPLQKHIDRVTLLTGLSGRVAGGGHSSGYGTLGAYLYRNAVPPSDITIDAALAAGTVPARREDHAGTRQLRCQSPAMVHKELLAGLIAHNLIRCVMAEAAQTHEAELERLSFKGTVDAVRQFSAALAQARNRKMRRFLWADLLGAVARDPVPLRPGRSEPRAVKRRPKPYPLLNRPRGQFVELPHRKRRWKGGPAKYRGLN